MYIHRPLWASLGLSGPLWASLGLSGPLWASLGVSGPLWASLGLSGPLWVLYVHTHICMYIKKTRQEPTAGASVFLGARSWQTTRPHNTYIPDSWSPSVLRGQNLQDKKTRQCPPAGAPVFLEARNCQTTKADNTYIHIYIHTRQLEPQRPSSVTF